MLITDLVLKNNTGRLLVNFLVKWGRKGKKLSHVDFLPFLLPHSLSSPKKKERKKRKYYSLLSKKRKQTKRAKKKKKKSICV